MKSSITTKDADSILVGAAGEHLVLSRLYSHRILASFAPPKFPDVDILVNPINGGRAKWIQVKSTETKGKDRGWRMSDEHLKLVSPQLFYCFVELSSVSQNVFVIPSRIVAKVLTETDKAYMKKPKSDGSRRTSHSRRMLKPSFYVQVPSAPEGWMDKYLEKWELLG
jgi:hypothetical protein